MEPVRIDSGVQTTGVLIAEAVSDGNDGAGVGTTATTSDSARLPGSVGQLISDRFRCLQETANFVIDAGLSPNSGYFRIGSKTVGFGQCSSGAPANFVTEPLHDAGDHISVRGSSVHLPFDPVRIIDNLRSERYPATCRGIKTLSSRTAFRNLYYYARPLMPTAGRRYLQRVYFRGHDKIPFPSWPVDRSVESLFEQLLVLSMKSRNVERVPFVWFWPEGAQSCAMVTHDVETTAGRNFCPQLMDLNDSFGIKSSFQIIPEKRYTVSELFLGNIRQRGFEINVHDLNHDGRLMCERDEFLSRARRINCYGREFGAQGFRSAVMYRNLDWYDALEFSYDMSIPNVAHLDPQQGGCCTVFPFFINKVLELPLTTTQDYSLFEILRDYSIQLWKKQIALIRQKHGLVSFSIHPDYMIHRAARRLYAELLQYLCELRFRKETWIALPGEVAAWWRLRSRMQLVKTGSAWRIEGEGSGRAKVAYAVRDHGRLTYEIPEAPQRVRAGSKSSR